MAVARLGANVPVGSAQWALNEREYAMELVDQEVTEFAFSARNEMDWLNEHMAEIFDENQVNVAEVFKTPGKLRGKTPRTARKRNVMEDRAPLSEIFAPISQSKTSPARHARVNKATSKFQVAEDIEDTQEDDPPMQRYSKGPGKENTDSGYHDMTDEEPVMHEQLERFEIPVPQKLNSIKSPQAQRRLEPSPVAQRHESDEWFVSAEEAASIKATTRSEPERAISSALIQPLAVSPRQGEASLAEDADEPEMSNEAALPLENASERTKQDCEEQDSPVRAQNFSTRDSSVSDESSPGRAVLRKKSSLTFATLPAREPLVTKKSFGARVSRISNLEHRKTNASTREGPVRRSTFEDPRNETQTKEFVETEQTIEDTQTEDVTLTRTAPDTTKAHNQSSTQRLHERITMLGKLTATHSSNLIHSHAASGLNDRLSADQSKIDAHTADVSAEDEADNWIGPIDSKTFGTSKHPATSGLAESVTGGQVTEPGFGTQDLGSTIEIDPQLDCIPLSSISYPTLAAESFTPSGSPVRKPVEGPLSASKARLYSVLKSARGIFASSAGISAHAKMETFSPQPSSRPEAWEDRHHITYPVLPDQKKAEMIVPTAHSPKTLVQKSALPGGLDARKDDTQHDHRIEAISALKQGTAENRHEAELDHEKVMLAINKPQVLTQAVSTFKISKVGEPKRPAKPVKDAALKSRPAPVAIRVASQRVGQAGPVPGNVLAESSTQAPSSKATNLGKKASSSSLNTSSSMQSFKTVASTSSARPKALEAAARKREQDEREAQRKADQKRDIERKRAAKAEDDRKAAQEQKAAEQRLLEAKQQAQRHASEQRKAEAAKRDQIRAQADAARNEAYAPTSFIDRAANPVSQQQQGRDTGMARPISRMGDHMRPAHPHVNPAKPPKRHFTADMEEDAQPLRGQQHQGSHQAKRRRTSELEDEEVPSRPPMAPPIRLSNMRKDMHNKFTYSYTNAQSSTHHPPHTVSLMKSTVTTQHNIQHPKTPHMNDLAKFSNARVPFAEVTNPPSTAQRGRPQADSKTPATAHKSSPQYPNGDSIDLPDIPTDSEDESDGDNDFQPPSWANSPALRDLLKQQQLIDPMKVFGPIAPLMMDEMFKGNKERLAKFRARTSSANWNGPDRVTEEERRKDWEARERLERDGAWTFQT